MSVSRDYEDAVRRSKLYAPCEDYVIPPEALSGVVDIPLGFQPLGVASRLCVDGTTELAIADYFMPAVQRFRVWRDGQGLHFGKLPLLDFVTYGLERVRLFPGLAVGTGASRAQTVNFDGQSIVVSPNYSKQLFRFDLVDTDVWALTGVDELPVSTRPSLHAALLDEGTLRTIEGDAAASSLFLCAYKRTNGWFEVVSKQALVGDFIYGIGVRANGTLLLVTDRRSSFQKGLLVPPSLDGESCRVIAVPGFDGTGNGVTVLSDGAVIVTQYNYVRGLFGAPGKLVYIPAHLLK